MSYTVVGMFPTTDLAEKASKKLDNAGFSQDDYRVSRYTSSGEYTKSYDYEEDEQTKGFWNWLFGDNENDRKKYSYAGSKSNIVTVYTDDMARAEKARDIMNDNGAVDVNDFTKDRFVSEEFASPDNNLTEAERARIINKAKNNLYFVENRNYVVKDRSEGMRDEMDSLGTDRF